MSVRVRSAGTTIDRPVLAVALLAVVATAIGALWLAQAALGGRPDYRTVRVDNQAALPVRVDVAGPDGGRLGLGVAGPRATTTFPRSPTTGATWTFVVSYGGQEVLRQPVSAQELAGRGLDLPDPRRRHRGAGTPGLPMRGSGSSMDIQETNLPGVGLRHDFTTRAGRQLGVVTHRTGRRDLLVYDREDPDACQEVVQLTDEEADALAELLGAARLVEHLAALTQRIEGLAIDWLPIRPGSPYAGRDIADTQARSRTGVSIVAILRGDGAIPAPPPTPASSPATPWWSSAPPRASRS